jgi:PilZ domain
MPGVDDGARLTLFTGDGRRVALRTLHGVGFEAGASVEVLCAALADSCQLRGDVEAVTATGVLRAPALLTTSAGGGLLTLTGAVQRLQRREHVRASARLPWHASDGTGRQLGGLTLDVSAGGLRAGCRDVDPVAFDGAMLGVRLQLPGRLVEAVLEVVSATDEQLQGRFVDITPADREQLVRLVFERMRAELASRDAVRRRLAAAP